jgi:hypothetical protein
MNFHERVAAVVDVKNGSPPEIARRFRVSFSFIVRLLKWRSEARSLGPRRGRQAETGHQRDCDGSRADRRVGATPGEVDSRGQRQHRPDADDRQLRLGGSGPYVHPHMRRIIAPRFMRARLDLVVRFPSLPSTSAGVRSARANPCNIGLYERTNGSESRECGGLSDSRCRNIGQAWGSHTPGGASRRIARSHGRDDRRGFLSPRS